MILQVGIGVVLGAAIVTALYFIIKQLRFKALSGSLDRELMLVKIPKEADPRQDNKQQMSHIMKTEISRFEQLLGGLTAIKKPVIFEIAVPHLGEEISFYISVP